MKTIIREDYLSKIRPFYNIDLIKVITGIRRSGKSIILRQIIDELKEDKVKDDHIIYINLENIDYDFINTYKDLNDYIVSKIKDESRHYIFVDEVQHIDKWEKTIASLKATKNVSIFITGSNSNLLKGDLSTLLSGRYISFKILPFSFREVCDLKELDKREDIEKEFQEYIKWGGMPQSFQFTDEGSRAAYLTDLFNSIIIKDIVLKNKIGDIELLYKLIDYLMQNPGKNFSITNIVNYLKNDGRTCSNETIYNYLNYILDACIIMKAPRYDLKGKAMLSTNEKYYITDFGLANIRNNLNNVWVAPLVENVVHNEFVKRGYEVLVGKNNEKEIDFIVRKNGNIEYYQVAYLLADESTINREFNAFAQIEDNYPKYILTLDNLDMSRDGIVHKNIIDFLLEK